MTPETKKSFGIYHKFNVTRTDWKHLEGKKHFNCDYLVLDLSHDPLAYHPVRSYAANAERAGYKQLSEDLYAKAEHMRLNGVCPKPVNDAKERFEVMSSVQQQLTLDAMRYRFLRDEDNFPPSDDNNDYWANLTELTLGEFDLFVDDLMKTANTQETK
jgi:hypothetical protein